MPAVLSVSIPGGVGTLSGQLQIADEGVTNLRRLYWPAGVNAIARHGTGYVYGNRNYLMGAWSANLMIDENFRVLRQGMIPPQSPPSVAVGGGATDQICYLSYYDADTDERSSLSEGFAVTGNTTRTWSNLPTTMPGEAAVIEGLSDIAADGTITQTVGSVTNYSTLKPTDKVAVSTDLDRWAVVRTVVDDQTMTTDASLPVSAGVELTHRPVSRATHLELWVSVAGTLPRLASRVPLGVTGWTEAVGTLSLGEAFLDTFEPLPFCTITNTYGDRQWAAGDPRNPDTLYGSALFQHERWEGLSFKTRFGEPITALIRTRDYLIVCCPSSVYILTGYTEDDLAMKGDASDLGCFGPVTYCVIKNLVFIFNNQGIWLYNGAWHRLNGDNQHKWIELCQRFPLEFQTGIAVYDPSWDAILFIPNFRDFAGTAYDQMTPFEQAERVVWVVGDIQSVSGAEAGGFTDPCHSWDSPYVGPNDDGLSGVAQIISAAFLVPTGTSIGRFIKVGRDGTVVEETPDSLVGGGMELWTGHSFLGNIGGDIEEGKTLKRCSAYFYGDYASCRWDIYAGNEYAQGEDWDRRVRQVAHSESSVSVADLYTPFTVSITGTLVEVVPAGPVPNYPGGTATWGVYEALTIHTWPEEISGRGFTHRFRFNGRHVEFYGLGGYYGPGPVARALTYATGPD